VARKELAAELQGRNEEVPAAHQNGSKNKQTKHHGTGDDIRPKRHAKRRWQRIQRPHQRLRRPRHHQTYLRRKIASQWGWGAVVINFSNADLAKSPIEIRNGAWHSDEKHHHINTLELLAIEKGLSIICTLRRIRKMCEQKAKFCDTKRISSEDNPADEPSRNISNPQLRRPIQWERGKHNFKPEKISYQE
jgi:hypothetical protein